MVLQLRFLNSHGDLTLPLTFLFALIIGAMFFLFFIGFGGKSLGLFQSLTAAEFLESMDSEFAAFSVSYSAEKVLTFSQNVDMIITQGTIHTGSQQKSFDKVVFSPSTLNGKEIVVASRSLDMPYRVASLYYLGDGRTLYVLVAGGGTKTVLEHLVKDGQLFPQHIPSLLFSEEELKSAELPAMASQYSSVQFILFSADDIESFLNDQFQGSSVIKIEPMEEDLSFGTVKYNDGSAQYAGYPLLLGAMISPSLSEYSFSLSQTRKAAAVVTDTYLQKSQFLSRKRPSCPYSLMTNVLSGYKTILSSKDLDISLEKIKAIESTNKDLGGECPVIY